MKNIPISKKDMQREYDRQMNFFCPDCGEKMVLKKFVSMYSPSTGQPMYELEGKCHNARWWRPGHYTRRYPMPVITKMKQGKIGNKNNNIKYEKNICN